MERKFSLSKSGLSRDDNKKFSNIIRALEKRPESFDFLKPVDYKSLGLDNYPLIIKRPMDLSTVRKKLKGNKYSNISEALSDLTLIWENCRTYNQIGSVKIM